MLLPIAAMARERRVHWGLGTDAAIKLQIFHGDVSPYGLFGHWGGYITTTIDGREENSLSFTHRTGFYRDNISFKVGDGDRYSIENINFIVNPEVLFPTRVQGLDAAVGFGLDWISNANVAFYNTGSDYAQTFDFDKVADTVISAQRKLVPFVSVGARWKASSRVYLHAYIRQNMQNSIYDDTQVTLGNKLQPIRLKMFHQPTYFGFAASFFFN